MRRLALPLALAFSFALAACGGGPDSATPARTATAEKWLSRAKQSYRSGDADDASVAIEGALKESPRDPDVRLMAARIALAKLDFNETVKQTEGLPGTEAKSLRGRAFWYSGDIERAADELEDMLRDPSVKDAWARDVAKLARRGQGRHPFAVEGALVASVEMPQAGPALVVPCELEGERILALVSTAMGEFMVDSASRKEPAWVNLRFGDNLEVKDVPALTYDLSNISRQLGAPIKALIGVNALRHMHVTFDRRGSQFVVRKGDPPAPPGATRVPLFFVRGGGMMIWSSVAKGDDGSALLFVDSSAFYPMALEDSVLKKSGADLASFRSEPGAPQNWKLGFLPYFKLGPLDLPQVPAMQGAPLAEYKQNFDVDLGGVLGSGLLAAFRVTFGDDGRYVWMELDPSLLEGGGQERPRGGAAPGPAPAAPEAAPKGGKPAPATPAAPAPAKPAKPEPAKGAPGAKVDVPKTESKGAAK